MTEAVFLFPMTEAVFLSLSTLTSVRMWIASFGVRTGNHFLPSLNPVSCDTDISVVGRCV